MRVFFRQQKRDDLVIALLRYGKSHLVKGTTFPEVHTHIKGSGHDYDLTHLESLFLQLFKPLELGYIGDNKHRLTEHVQHGLAIDGYFNLLEHDELEQARSSSKCAMYIAVFAIVISIVVAGISILKPTDVKIVPDQIDDFASRLAQPK